VSSEVDKKTVSELCQIPPETPVKHRDLRGHSDAHRCCGKSLIGSALVRFGVRQHARAESISKRAPSTARTSLLFRINGLRAVRQRLSHTLARSERFARSRFPSGVCSLTRTCVRRNGVRPRDVVRSLTASGQRSVATHAPARTCRRTVRDRKPAQYAVLERRKRLASEPHQSIGIVANDLRAPERNVANELRSRAR